MTRCWALHGHSTGTPLALPWGTIRLGVLFEYSLKPYIS